MIKSARFAALALGLGMFAAPAMAQDSPVLGTWDTAAVTDFGTFESQVTISGSEDGYTIVFVDAPMPGAPADAPAMESTISNVVIEGNTFSFTRSLTTPQGPMELNYAGTVDGDALEATIGSQMGEIPVSGTRAE